jgi:thiol-disulfide isomerase/thioredoxin
MGKKRWTGLLVGIAVVAAVAGFAVQSLLPREEKSSFPAPAAGEKLFGATFADLAGNAQGIDQWRGKVIVVNFWATWCPPCLKEIPEFIRMQTRYRDQGLQFVGIAIDQPEKVTAYAEKVGFNYPVLVGAMDALEHSRVLGNRQGALPFTVVFDRKGTLVSAKLGALDEAKLSTIIQPLL